MSKLVVAAVGWTTNHVQLFIGISATAQILFIHNLLMKMIYKVRSLLFSTMKFIQRIYAVYYHTENCIYNVYNITFV